jgi:DNA end-binding protein Ku
MQGIWSGTISFSLVAIPVQLVRAVAPGRISFRTLHKSDYSPLRRRMFCPSEEEMIPPDDMVRGYEIAPGRYIPVTDEELESLSPERSRTIEIIDFIAMDEVDPVYFDRPYYLVPLKGGEKSYRLLAEVMAQTNRGGVAKFVLAEREHPVLVRSAKGALLLTTLHYSNELLKEEIPPKAEKVVAADKSRVRDSIRRMTTAFDPMKYADDRRQRMLEILKRKREETGTVEAPQIPEEAGEAPPDLMAALEEAMAEIRKNR